MRKRNTSRLSWKWGLARSPRNATLTLSLPWCILLFWGLSGPVAGPPECHANGPGKADQSERTGAVTVSIHVPPVRSTPPSKSIAIERPAQYQQGVALKKQTLSSKMESLRLAIQDLQVTFGAAYPEGDRYLDRWQQLATALATGKPNLASRVDELRNEALLANPLLDLLHAYVRPLMVMNPDGSGQRAVYGSNSYYPNSLFFPRSVPGHPTKIAAILAGYHGLNRMGELAVLDIAVGWKGQDGVMHRITHRGEPVVPVAIDPLTQGASLQFLHPLPLSDKYLLTAMQPGRGKPWGIYLVDVFDNIVPILVEPGYDFFEPLLVQQRPVPLDLPDQRRLELARAFAGAKDDPEAIPPPLHRDFGPAVRPVDPTPSCEQRRQIAGGLLETVSARAVDRQPARCRSTWFVLRSAETLPVGVPPGLPSLARGP